MYDGSVQIYFKDVPHLSKNSVRFVIPKPERWQVITHDL